MFDAIGHLAALTGRLDAIRPVSAALIRADDHGAAAELVTVLQEVGKTFTGFEEVLKRYLSLQFTDATRVEDEEEIVALAGGQVRPLTNQMRRCGKIGIIYRLVLQPWFDAAPIPPEDRANLHQVFTELANSDANMIVPAVDELAGWLQGEVNATAASVDAGRYKEARERIRTARGTIIATRQEMAQVNGTFLDLEIQFTPMTSGVGGLLLAPASGGTSPIMTLAVPLIAASAALAVAVVAAVTAGRRQRRELAHDRELADVTELRSVLDAAGVNLERAARLMKDPPLPHRVNDEVTTELASISELLAESAQRIRIRVGPSELQKAYDQALEAHLLFVEQVTQGPGDGQDEPTAPGAFTTAREAFLVGAHAAVGVRRLVELN